MVVLVEDKDPMIVVIVFFLSVFLSKRVVVTKSDDVSVFFFQLDEIQKRVVDFFWMDGMHLFFLFWIFFCVCDFKTLNPKDSVKGKGVSFVPLRIRRTLLN